LTEVKIIADSIGHHNRRLTTMQLKFHRIVLAEFNTHRMFSRNASSSRAIPVKTLLKRVEEDPAMPVYWGANQKGMQAKQELEGDELEMAKRRWLQARDEAIHSVRRLEEIGLHKQLSNRLLEPWMWCYVVVTATDWENFFNLRCHPDAQPEIHALAVMMRDAMRESTPKVLKGGEWHLPYVMEGDREAVGGVLALLQKISTARCARVSYKTHDGQTPSVAKDIELHDMLLSSGHMSPLEHSAMNMEDFSYHGNFCGWWQYRKFLPRENIFQG
jgi:hypothetical protein